MPKLTRDGVEINYQTFGQQGFWVTLVNGHTRSSSDFKLFSKRLVDEGFRVLCFDNRGSGQTIEIKEFTLNDMVEDVIALWQHLDIGKTHLLGISMGGVISQYLAFRVPEKLASLCLVSTYSDLSELSGQDQGWSEDVEDLRSKMKAYFSQKFLQQNRLLFDSMIKQMHKSIGEGDFVKRANAQRKAMKQNPSEEVSLSQLKTPTMIFHGDLDKVINPKAAKNLHDKIPHSHLKLYEGIGHLILAENAKEFYGDVVSFFRDQAIDQ